MESQSGYGQSKWESRIKNERKARDRKGRAQREKETRIQENKEKARVHRAQTFKSQFGIKEVIDFTFDAPDWITDTFGKYWLLLRDIATDFNFSLPEITIPDFGKYWFLVKESEVFF